MPQSEYTLLKQQIVDEVRRNDNNNRLLNHFKEFYKDEIDSNRRFEQIDMIGKLLRVLEIRDVLSEDNVEPLKEIARLLNNNYLLKKISAYEITHVPREYNVNFYHVKHNSVSGPQTHELPSGHPYGNISVRKKLMINNTMVEQIGTHWRDLARNLKIQECKIDEIEREKNTMAEKVRSLLELYESKADPQRGFYVLCNALEKARRKDLSKLLQEIMFMQL